MNDPPVLRVIRGGASDEELAALVAALAAVTAPSGVNEPDEPAQPDEPDEPNQPRRSAWTDREALLHPTPRPGPGAWRASAWPR